MTSGTRDGSTQSRFGPYVAEQVLQVVVGRALPLVLGQLLHVAVQAKVQPS